MVHTGKAHLDEEANYLDCQSGAICANLICGQDGHTEI